MTEDEKPVASVEEKPVTGEAEVLPAVAEKAAEPVESIVVAEAPAVADNPDAPMLPEAYSENELRDAVGAAPRRERAGRHRRPENLDEPAPKKSRPVIEPDVPSRAPADTDDDDDRRGWSRRSIVVLVSTAVAGVLIAALIFLGRANTAHFAIACHADKIVAEQGRAFPPWGTRERTGAEWKPIEIPPEAECQQRSTDEEPELATWYLDALEDRATTLLDERDGAKVDLAEQQLNQALLLARAPEKKDKRADLERLLGDVAYWRASAKLRDATTALTAAAKQFDAAAAQRPRIVTDASAWANYIRKLVDELHAGPNGAPATATTFPPLAPPSTERPAAPPGTALPVEPADVGSGSAAPVATPPPDAGVPTGGVLL